MSIFSASSYDSLPPATPSPRAPALPHSPSPSSGSLSMSTPPESLREYSSAMRARMTVAWAAALKDLKDDGYPSVASRRLDPEFGFDEDPIERHVRQFLSPNTKRREMEAKGLGIQVKVDLDLDMGGDTSMREGHRGDGSRSKEREEVMMDDIDNHAGEGVDVDVDVAFHPGLIDFGKPAPTGARLSRPPLPSWLSRTSTTTSLEPNTPSSGSTFSDASFEAASNEDYMNMYGRDSDIEMQGRAYGPAGPGPSSLTRIKSISSRDRMSIASISTTTSTATFGSTITSLSTSTVTAVGPAAVPVSVPVSISPIRPGLARPRPRVRPLRPHPLDGTPTKPSPRRAQEDDSGMEEWLDGRTDLVAKFQDPNSHYYLAPGTDGPSHPDDHSTSREVPAPTPTTPTPTPTQATETSEMLEALDALGTPRALRLGLKSKSTPPAGSKSGSPRGLWGKEPPAIGAFKPHSARLSEARTEGRKWFREKGFDEKGRLEWPVAWGDCDMFQHANNVNFVRWCESARIKYAESFGDELHAEVVYSLLNGRGTGFILKDITVRYKYPVTYPDTLMIASKPHNVKQDRAAFGIEHAMWSLKENRVVATAESTMVMYDYDRKTKGTLSDELRDVLLRRIQVAEEQSS